MISVEDLCDYIIAKCDEANTSLNNLKLQKLAYYADAWHLAFYSEKLINDKFMAWIHGPVCRAIYDRFKDYKSLYSMITVEDMRESFNAESLGMVKNHIDKVLHVYAKYSGSQLEEMTHNEEPWINAREGYKSAQRCEVEISDEDIISYYKQRIA